MRVIQNKYLRVYNDIIYRASSRDKGDFKGEKHHIIPRSLGGSNSKDNLALLTYREHFICHLLLVRFLEGEEKEKMAYALFRMANCRKEAYCVSSRTYEIARKAKSSTSLTKEQRDKISAAHKGIPKGPMSDETKAKLSARVVTAETRKLMSDARQQRTGWSHSEETKKKMSQSQKERVTNTVTCEKCGYITTPNNMSRWHQCDKRYCINGHDLLLHSVRYSGRLRCKVCLNHQRRERRSRVNRC